MRRLVIFTAFIVLSMVIALQRSWAGDMLLGRQRGAQPAQQQLR